MQISRIVVVAERSMSSMAAIRQGRRLAETLGAVLDVVHVFDAERAERFMNETGLSGKDLESSIRNSFLEYLRKHWAEGEEPAFQIEIGHPCESAINRCGDGKADLLVIGGDEEEEEGFGGEILAKKRARHAPVKVLVCRRDTHEKGFRRVVVCVDFSAHSEEALQVARRLAALDQAELHVVHVAPPDLPAPESEEEYEGMIQSRLESLAASGNGEAPPVCHVLSASKPSKALVSFLRLHRADLAVFGTKGRSGIDAMIMGTTAERLVESAPCSVLTVRT